MKAARQTGMDPAILASAGSVALSWYYFFARGDRMRGLFVGLWAPTILAFASYYKQTRMHDRMQRAMGKSGITNKVQRMVEGVNQ
ncbi:hypothetical protein HUG12_20750 (plasmid) [Halorarum salinum]|uniref:Uncharacterized protein n=2 Tax=Halorarum salinum TaxID=2743089 RepID=A0A7D5QET5_9EURY|nr:hypothetical protein HUG12_20750 [Halobaculum salinum]